MIHLVSSDARVHLAAVIPAYNVAMHIRAVLAEIPEEIRTIIVVEDGSSDDTAAVVGQVAAADSRIELIRQPRNRGVGAAMVTGFKRALDVGAEVIIKIDGDGQMPLALLPKLIHPLVTGQADYVKGDRFRDLQAIQQMPAVRRFGNIVLGFLAKGATGYWHCFDPTNGFVAIRADVLRQVPLHHIDEGYYFEISMLSNLYLLGAVVKDEPMPARYQGAPSSLSIPRVLAEFPLRLFASLVRRVFLRNFVYDFTVESLHLIFGLILLLAGAGYGGYQWVWHATNRVAAPTGTVVLSAVLILIGVQLLISAISLDLQSVPREPMNDGPIPAGERRNVDRGFAARGRRAGDL